MPTQVYIQNNLATSLGSSTTVSPSLSNDYWGVTANSEPNNATTEVLWMDRNQGITNHDTWIFTTTVNVGGADVLLQEQLTGTFASSDISVQIVASGQNTGWQSSNTSLTFNGTDGNQYRITATWSADGTYDDLTFAISQVGSAPILQQIQHVVVLMNENRSLDNLLGWIYGSTAPSQVLPAGSPSSFNGLTANTYSNTDPNVDDGQPVYASCGTTAWSESSGPVSSWFVPSPDPGEEFEHVNVQVFNGGVTGEMSGFLTDFVGQVNANGGPAGSAAQIMQSYSPTQLSVISTLAQSFAVSDAWFSSVPTQTWPNRGFAQTGSSDGTTNNDDYIPWDIGTIFDVLQAQSIPWMVYNDGTLQSLTKTMFLAKYFGNETNFSGITEFETACAQPAGAPANQKLPAFSWVEPNFGVIGADESYHPPHDVRPGEAFLARIYNAIQASPYRDNILFVVIFDEHGGTYDHVVPPSGAAQPLPDPVATDGTGFTYSRFGVRIPAIVISSYVQPGTVFRSNTSVPLDHTSVLATLRDWLGLSSAFQSMLPSPRIAAAPNLAYVLTESTPQSWPSLSVQSTALADVCANIAEPPDEMPLNDVQRGILIGAAALAGGRPYTEAESRAAHARLRTYHDARSFLEALKPHLPLK
jgi:phospholipase C